MTGPTIAVRDARPSDGPAMGRVHVVAWQVGYAGMMPHSFLDGLSAAGRGAAWTDQLAGPPSDASTLVAVVDGGQTGPGIAGIATYGPYRMSEDETASTGRAAERTVATSHDGAAAGLCELWMLNVHPDHWGTGVAQALMSRVIDRLRAERSERVAALWVLDTNARGRRFYEKQGWRHDGAVKVDHRDGFDLTELRYVRDL